MGSTRETVESRAKGPGRGVPEAEGRKEEGKRWEKRRPGRSGPQRRNRRQGGEAKHSRKERGRCERGKDIKKGKDGKTRARLILGGRWGEEGMRRVLVVERVGVDSGLKERGELREKVEKGNGWEGGREKSDGIWKGGWQN